MSEIDVNIDTSQWVNALNDAVNLGKASVAKNPAIPDLLGMLLKVPFKTSQDGASVSVTPASEVLEAVELLKQLNEVQDKLVTLSRRLPAPMRERPHT